MARKPCAGLWNSITIDVDGNITTCCLDEEMKNKIGNIDEIALYEAWHGEKITKWRQAQIEGRFNESGPMCKECNFLAAEQLTEEEVEHCERRSNHES